MRETSVKQQREAIIGNIAHKAFDAATNTIGNTIDRMKGFAASTVEIGKAFDSSMSNIGTILGYSGLQLYFEDIHLIN